MFKVPTSKEGHDRWKEWAKLIIVHNPVKLLSLEEVKGMGRRLVVHVRRTLHVWIRNEAAFRERRSVVRNVESLL